MNAATFTIAAEAANAKSVLVQLGSRPLPGNVAKNIGGARVLELYLSSDATGDTIVNPVGTGIVPTDGGEGVLLDAPEATEQPIWRVKTDATGKVRVLLTNAGDENETVYLNAILADGKVVTSAAIVFADDTP